MQKGMMKDAQAQKGKRFRCVKPIKRVKPELNSFVSDSLRPTIVMDIPSKGFFTERLR